MTRVAPLAVLLLAAVFLATTGFQCGSAETTSAKLYMQQKQWDKAEQSLLKEVQKNDKDAEAWFLLGQVRLELKRYKDMDEAYTHSLQVSETHRPEISRNRLAVWAMLYNEGVKFYNEGRDSASSYDKAIEDFTTAIELEPDSSTTYYVAALAWYAKKDYQKAVATIETALQKKPNFADAAKFLGQVHYQQAVDRLSAKDEAGAQAEFVKATQAFENVYKLEPDSISSINNLIDVYDRTKNMEKALALTRDAVAKQPNNKFFRFAYGVFLMKQDNFPSAIEQFEKTISIDPAYSDAHYNLGVSYVNWGVSMKKAADEKAEADQKKAGKGKHVNTDESYREKLKLALPHLEKSVELQADDAGKWMQLGRLYTMLNMPDKSRAAFEKSDSLSKTH
jgi:tetratricopeptide (TPR) repeat protein